jgi:hypothetical protein
MRYFTWKLDWSSGEGTDPASFINSETVRLSPHFSVGSTSDSDTLIYGYLQKGEINASELVAWSVTEITLTEMFDAAKSLLKGAYVEDDLVKFPSMPVDDKAYQWDEETVSWLEITQ